MAETPEEPRPAHELSDAELDAELERLDRAWDEIHDPNRGPPTQDLEVERERHVRRLHEVEREWDRRHPI